MFKKIFLFLAVISAVGVLNHPVWAGTDPGDDTGGAGTEPQSVLDKLIAGISGKDSGLDDGWHWECDLNGEQCTQELDTRIHDPVPEPSTPTSDQPTNEEPPVCNPEDPEDESPPAEEESHAASDGSYVKKTEISLAQLYKFLHSAPGASYSLNGLIMTVNKATLTNQCTAEVTMRVTITHLDGTITNNIMKINRNGARLEPIPVSKLKPKK